jgi:hypothetical protein
MKLGKRAWVRKTCVLLGMSVTLAAGGLVNAAPALAQPLVTSEEGFVPANSLAVASQLAIPACVNSLPPTGGFYFHARYSNPNACRKCQEVGARFEAEGRFDAHCQNIYNPAGTLTAVVLYLRCIACRNIATAAIGNRSEMAAEIQARQLSD